MRWAGYGEAPTCLHESGGREYVRFRKMLRRPIDWVTSPKLAAKCMAVATLLLVANGCERRDEKIQVYRLEKAPLESPPLEKPGGGVMPPVALPMLNASAAAVPANWETQPPSQMRQASYLVHGANGAVADISLVTLGPSAGAVLENVNRWLGQLGQPPITDAQLPSVVQHLPSELGHVAVVDLQGKPEQGDASKDGRILAAIAPAENGTLFFKARGNVELVGAEKENFLKWVGSFRK